MDLLTPEELQAIAERCSGATPGPWTVEEDSRPSIMAPAGTGGYMDGGHLATFMAMTKYDAAWGNKSSNSADADFIAHARTDVPRLLELIQWLIRSLQAELVQTNS